MQRLWQQHSKTIILLLYLLGGVVANRVVSHLIGVLYPDRPMVPDILFDSLPLWMWTQYLSDPLLILSFIVFMYSLRKRMTMSFFNLILLSVAHIHYMRAAFIGLTPLGRYPDNFTNYGIFDVPQNGMFSSGHTAAALLLFLLVPQEEKNVRKMLFIFFLLQVLVLLLSRGHYSIDIAGGCMVAYIGLQMAKQK